jgi:hypothetical protein
VTIWDDIDKREAAYKVECDRTLTTLRGMLEARHGEDLLGETTVGQDEFGWWRATVKIWVGFGANSAPLFRDLTYQARSSEGLVQAVREKREAA